MSKHFENLATQLDKLARHNRQGSFRTRQRYYEAMLRFCRFLAGREDYITVLYLGRYAALRIHECFRIDTATAAKAIKEAALTIKGKGGLVRTVPLNAIVTDRLKKHLETTPRGQKLFVPDDKPTHKAIKDFQSVLAANRPYAQDAGSNHPMTFHGLRHTRAAEWYVEFTKQGQTPYQARKAVYKLLGHGRDDVTRIYLASLNERDAADGK